jgi:hypothetical protein
VRQQSTYLNAVRSEVSAIARLCRAVLQKFPADYEPWGKVDFAELEYPNDCSCGCRFYLALEGCGDYGVCANPKSYRASLLTHEHQGCQEFEPEPEEE